MMAMYHKSVKSDKKEAVELGDKNCRQSTNIFGIPRFISVEIK